MPAVGPINIRAVKKKNDRFIGMLERKTDETLKDAGEYFQEHVRTKSRFKRRTAGRGSQKEQTGTRLLRTKKNRLLKVRHPRTNHAQKTLVANVLEYGSRTPIRPRYAQYLRFRGRGGQIIYRKWVRGVKPRKFFYLARVSTTRWLDGEVRKRLMQSAKRF